MSANLPHDPKWKRANTLFASPDQSADIAVVGVPTHKGSISPTNADQTPDAIRSALARYSTYSTSQGVDLSGQSFIDLGNIDSPDGPDGVARVGAFVSGLLAKHKLVIALGGEGN